MCQLTQTDVFLVHASDISPFGSRAPSVTGSTQSAVEAVSLKEYVRRNFRYALFKGQHILGKPNSTEVFEILQQEWSKGLAAYNQRKP